MTIASATIVNRALNLAGCEITIGDLQDGTREAQIALQHYTMTVWFLLRTQDQEFSRKIVSLVPTGNGAPLGWTTEFEYPADCLRLRTLAPLSGTSNSPLPVRWDVGTALRGGTQSTVIWSSLAAGKVVYTSNLVTEDDWNPGFTETVVQYLSSTLAPLLSPRDAKGQPGKEGPAGYAQAARISQIDVDKDS